MARIQKQSGSPLRGVTSEQLREAERGLRLALRSTYAPVWIARNVRDLLAEANLDYAEWAVEHGPARNPTGWLIEHAHLQASKLVARENRRSGPPLESVIHSIEDRDPSPEDAALELDRIRRIEEALSRIPDNDRRLLALVYREGHSVRAAGRLLGWGATNAHHHHRQAMDKLRALLGPRDLIGLPLLGVVAQNVVLHDHERVGRIANRVSAAAQDLSDLASRAVGSARREASDAIGRALPFTETGSSAALSNGAGRALAQCGTLVAAAICSAALAIPATHGVEAILPHHQVRTGAGRARDEAPDGPRSEADPTPRAPAPVGKPPPFFDAVTRAVRQKETEEKDRRQRRHRRRRHRARIRRARRAEKAREVARAKASRAKRREEIEATEAAEAVAPEVVEAAPEPEAVAPEVEASPPPAATGGQTRQEFGL